MSNPRLSAVTNVVLSRDVITDSLEALQEFGEQGLEGFLLWLGRVEGSVAKVTAALVPPQHSIRDETGVGYFVTNETLFNLNLALAENGLRLIAQVHSHPTEAYHSAADDAGAIATTNGSFSLVVPDFGFTPPDIRHWAIHRLKVDCWTRLSTEEVERVFCVES